MNFLNRINELSILHFDKILHFIGGIFIGICFVAIFVVFKLQVSIPAIFFAALVVGAIKEIIYDKIMKKGTPSVFDAAATAAGAFPVMVVVFLMQRA